jgi:tRNA threonylcarbamoyladenosine biosynthesis protein TsaB
VAKEAPRAVRGPVIGIDTATSSASVALVEEGKVRAQFLLSSGRTHADALAWLIQRALEGLGIRAQDLGGVAVSAGPGSFTGLRIGIGTALGLAAALRIPLVGVETLWAYAEGVPPQPLWLCPTLDAKRGEVFAALFRQGEGGLMREGEDWVLSPEALCERIPGPTLFFGEGSERYRELILARVGGWARFLPPSKWPLGAGVVALAGWARIARGESDPPAGFRPKYVRDPEAEVMWRRRYAVGKGEERSVV